uniref:Homeo box B9 n=1 Tax=Rattus norvegicus TaxID=10116 RepID=A0ABK0LS28_RAT|eukprot:XP_017452621.1 PREDICTED: homeobox protein Hox-B9 isoform X1 [Rattus norvegicus]
MSISGTLSSYYVDSIISHESEDAPPAKFPSGQYANPRQPGHAEHLDFPSCSFQPKAPVFGASWAPLSPHASGSLPSVYHPYLQPQGAPAAESRYLRTWLEPAPRAEAAPGQGQAAVKAEPLLGAPGELLKQGTPEYSLETSAGREAVLSNQRAGYGDNKICEGSEDKERPDQRRREPFDIQPEGQRKTPPKLRVGTSPPPPAKYTAGSVLLLMHGSTSAKQASVRRKEANIQPSHRAERQILCFSGSPCFSIPSTRGLLFPLVDFCSRFS